MKRNFLIIEKATGRIVLNYTNSVTLEILNTHIFYKFIQVKDDAFLSIFQHQHGINISNVSIYFSVSSIEFSYEMYSWQIGITFCLV